MRISAIIKTLEDFANPMYQEDWDNTGVQVGNTASECTGVLVCLDVTPAIVDEAIAKKCNLIISHHPLFFRPVKRLTGATLQEATAINAIAAGITIYSSHTAADSTPGGVSYEMARLLGVNPLRVLSPLADRLILLQAIVPVTHVQEVEAALFDAGAGQLGNYDCCSFTTKGEGKFRALDGATPFVGEPGKQHTEDEVMISVVLTRDIRGEVERALLDTHPYETPAYYFTPLLNTMREVGLGVYGVMDNAMSQDDFINKVKEAFGCTAVRTTKMPNDPDRKIRRVAMCGGAGAEFISRAIAMGAQAYVTADLKYHDFVDYRDRILVIDAGHFDTEAPIKQAMARLIKEWWSETPVYCTDTEDNPINYK